MLARLLVILGAIGFLGVIFTPVYQGVPAFIVFIVYGAMLGYGGLLIYRRGYF